MLLRKTDNGLYRQMRGVARRLEKAKFGTHDRTCLMATFARNSGKPTIVLDAACHPYGHYRWNPMPRSPLQEYLEAKHAYQRMGFVPQWFKNKYPKSPLSLGARP